MNNKEKDLSDYIDSLNKERKPKAHGSEYDLQDELDNLYNTVRLVRSLNEPNMPNGNYPNKLARAVDAQLSEKNSSKKNRKSWYIGFTAVAAALIMVIMMNSLLPFKNSNIAYAMNEAFEEVKAYHGFLEIIESNANGESTTQAKLEVWADKEGRYIVKELEGFQEGVTTYNNGTKKWQVRPEQKQVHVFPAFPDAYVFTFELGKEIKGVSDALETKVIKDDKVSGRQCTLIEVSPKGGVSYKLWVDKKTKLPLQKQYAMQNALQYKVTYTNIDFVESIPTEKMAFKLPEGYIEINANPELILSNLGESTGTVGFTPKTLETIPNGYIKDYVSVNTNKKIVKQHFSSSDKKAKIIVIQGKSINDFKPSSTAILGKVNGNTAEIMSPVQESLGIIGGAGPYSEFTNINSIRWQQSGFEYAVIGNVLLSELTSFVKNLTDGEVEIPKLDDTSTKPKIKVPVDLTIVENEQKSVDAGHSPWKLDPAFVAQVFVSLKISPEGIVGDYPVKYENLKVVQNTGNAAIVEVKGENTPIKNVYLKRLIRQDSTGIWTVVGFDPLDNK